ncbi:CoA transferase [Streptomyces sp. NPDC001276]|uniref:CoA transferase n=1 Tax=Streptomyces sp. NPDC001276 TaxID=3364555 RepID=UPI0036878DD9
MSTGPGVALVTASRLAHDLLNRGKRAVVVDLRPERGLETVLRLVEHADVLIEGFRPGVTERLSLGPQECPSPAIRSLCTGG